MPLRKSLILRLLSFLIFLTTVYFSLLIDIGNRAEQDTKIKSDVIIVLGARSYKGGGYNPCLEARMNHAVDLYKSQYAPKILVTGGTDKEDSANEAETMKKMAIEKGIPETDILMENQATSTYENFLLSKTIMNNNQLKSAIIVTEPFHTARASLVASNLNYTYTQSPAKQSKCWIPNKYLTKYFLKEPLAILSYKLQNKL